MTKPIVTLEDVQLLVDTFYGKVRQDALLAPIFNEVIEDRWPEHLEKLYKFWQTVLLREHTYYGSPFLPHSQLPVDQEHFDRWISLFYQTIDELFTGERAEEARMRASAMAQMFKAKIDFYREHPHQTPL